MRPTWGRGSGAKLFGAIALFAFATVLARSAEADDVPLRVCADPNNLPFSDSAGAGFENKIVGLVRAYLHRPLEFVWRAERRGFVREGLSAGECDLVAAIPSGARIALATRPYYRSTYVFVSKPGEPPVTSLDDPSLRTRKIGVQLIGDDGMNSPPAHALTQRGIVENVRGFMVYGDYRDDHPLSGIVHAVERSTLQPCGGRSQATSLQKKSRRSWSPPSREMWRRAFQMTFDISMGVRRTDKPLKAQVDSALSSLAPQIGTILAAYGVPVAWEPSADR